MKFEKATWLSWWGGTILLVLAWMHVVSGVVGWIGFIIAGVATLGSVVRNRYWRPPGGK